MAVLSNIKFKGVDLSGAYVSYNKHSVQKQVEIIDEVETKQYTVLIELLIFVDDTKKDIILSAEISFCVENTNDISYNKIWSEIKKKYAGEDII